MSNDSGTVAPKERVNIVYKSEVDGNEEKVELPLKVLVAGKFTDNEDEDLLENRKKINVNKNNLNDVLKAQKVKVDFCVENKLSEDNNDDAEISVSLDINSMKDFEPDSITQKVPELKNLLELRNALTALKGPLGNLPEFRKKIDSIIKDSDAKAQILKELEVKE
jgi:type VI secretion system protein ImpB